MNYEEYVFFGFIGLVTLTLIVLIAWRIPKRLKQDKYTKRWKALQELCADKEQWPIALAQADDLLGEALKKRKYRGSSMGERLVSAQKKFSNNDAVWFGHKLRTRLDENPGLNLTKEDVQKGLIGLRQGLKDIGAL